jgi:hypothetical protein
MDFVGRVDPVVRNEVIGLFDGFKSLRRQAAALILGAWLFGVGCGSVTVGPDDASISDDAAPTVVEDAGLPADASVGGADGGEGALVPSPPATELTGGGARLDGETYQMDVQIGHPFGQQPTAGESTSVDPNTAVKP